VEFQLVANEKPLYLVEVKLSDDSFAPALFRYHSYFPEAKAVQMVLNLRKPKMKNGIIMTAAADFLKNLNI